MAESDDKPEDIEITLACTIEEFYLGSLKTIKYQRDALLGDGVTLESEDKTMVIEVKPDYNTSTVLRFAGKGHQKHAEETSDLVVRFSQEKSETNFSRVGNDLIYNASMSLADAIIAKPFKIQTLDKRVINVKIDEPFTPQLVFKVPGEGMPTVQRGDLLVKF